MSFFSLVSMLVVLAAASSYVNYRYIKLPTTVGVMLVALVASLTLVLIGPCAGGFREQAATLVSQIDFNQVVLHGMLAFLLFAGSIQVSLEELAREWLPVSLLAIFGTLVSTCIVGGVTWLVLGWLGLGIPFLHALLFGALISPTDPIAVLGIMKSVGAPRRLEVQVAGESLFNDRLGASRAPDRAQMAGGRGSGNPGHARGALAECRGNHGTVQLGEDAGERGDSGPHLGRPARRHLGGHGAVAAGQRLAQSGADPHLLRGCVLDPCPRLDGGPGDPDDQWPDGGPAVIGRAVMAQRT
jgi:hypothetical protein